MLKYIPEACAFVSLVLAIACIMVWASIIDRAVRADRGYPFGVGANISAKDERSSK
jgi:hypothetical protein